MTRTRTVAAIGAAALMGVALLAGCSSSNDSGDASAAASEGTTEMLPPVIITEEQTEATCKVGNFLDIIVPEDQMEGTTVDSSDEAIITVTQAKEEGGAIFNPGGECIAPGSATVTVTNPDGSSRDIAVTVTE